MATVCGVNKIDSNVAGVSVAQEECLKQLPGTNGQDAEWYAGEANSYADFGGQNTTVARAPINASRQRKKGKVVDVDASGGFNQDLRVTNIDMLLMMGFCFADAIEPATTYPLTRDISVPRTAIAAVVAADDKFEGTGMFSNFRAGQIVHARGFTNGANNGLFDVTAATANDITVDGVLVDESGMGKTAAIEAVGRAYAAGDVVLAVSGGTVTLTATVGNFAELAPGQWVFVGGDAPTSGFGAGNTGFARVKTVSADTKVVTFDLVVWQSPVGNSGAGVSLELFYGKTIRNQKDPAKIIRRTFNIERTLGEDAAGPQAEYLTGAVANQLTINLPGQNIINSDFTFVACDNEQRNGTQGLKPGVRYDSEDAAAFNTTSDLVTTLLYVHDNTTVQPDALFGYVQESTITVNNNVQPSKALGVMGAFDTTAGDFEVSGDITAYFTSTAATAAVRNNADVGLYMALAAEDATGVLFDMPLVGLGGGRIGVEKDREITVPLQPDAAESSFGYTFSSTWFRYLPDVARTA